MSSECPLTVIFPSRVDALFTVLHLQTIASSDRPSRQRSCSSRPSTCSDAQSRVARTPKYEGRATSGDC